MFEPLAPLEPLILLDSGGDDNDEDVLLQVQPRFYVPRLREQPQDPIINTLKSKQENALNPLIYSDVQPLLPPELVALAESWISEKDRSPEILWSSAMGSDRELTVSNLQYTVVNGPRLTPFILEQNQVVGRASLHF